MSFKVGLTIQKVGNIRPSQFIRLTNVTGLEHIEFDPTVFKDIDNVRSVLKCKSVTIHAPYFVHWFYDLSSGGKERKIVEQFVDNVNQNMKVLNIHSVVVHPPLDSDLEFFYENLSNLKPLILLENLFEMEPSDTWENFVQFYQTTNQHLAKPIGFCFDIPHSFIQHGEKFLDLPDLLITKLKEKSGYIHISGGTRTEDTHYPLLKEGEIPLKRVKRFLDEIGFKGIINMELQPYFDQGGLVEQVDKILQSQELLLGWAGARKQKMLIKLKKRFLFNKLRTLTI